MGARRKRCISLPPAVLERAEKRAADLGGNLAQLVEALLLADERRPIAELGPTVASLQSRAAVRRAECGRATVGSARAGRARSRET